MKSQSKDGSLSDKIKELRVRPSNNFRNITGDRPVSFWIKEDRLLAETGKEFTIILRTKGCSWALGSTGGCSMCGYVRDAAPIEISTANLNDQISYAFNEKSEEINNESDRFVLKIFNSGSFFDDKEISKDSREFIYQKVSNIDKISEFVVESRVEYITRQNLKHIKQNLNDKHVEIAIGLETVDDYIRNKYINKGLKYKDFLNAVSLCRELGIGIRVYLLFKPPFLNEQAAIDDCIKSIKSLIDLKVDTISINPVNIQKDSFIEYLFYQNRYRPPYFYSLFKCIKNVYTSHPEAIRSIRLISDPSGAGTKRGIHNCLKRECNSKMIEALRLFVLSQDYSFIINTLEDSDCDCLLTYRLQKNNY